MAENTAIEWADHTFNGWEGCTKVGPGCDNCYAENRNQRFHGGANWGTGAPRRRTSAENWKKPLKWDREAEEAGVRARVFCSSLSDVFDNEVPPKWRHELFHLIGNTPNLDWLLLTKRIGNVTHMLRCIARERLPRNVWIGATIVNQEEADRDILHLLRIPARVHFLSMEPLLGSVDLTRLSLTRGRRLNAFTGEGDDPDGTHWWDGLAGVDWVIVGGESGTNARPMHPMWAMHLRDQCRDAGVPFLFKQWGEWAPSPDGGFPDDLPSSALHCFQDPPWKVWRFTKKVAGRCLDGRNHTEFPTPYRPQSA